MDVAGRTFHFSAEETCAPSNEAACTSCGWGCALRCSPCLWRWLAWAAFFSPGPSVPGPDAAGWVLGTGRSARLLRERVPGDRAQPGAVGARRPRDVCLRDCPV